MKNDTLVERIYKQLKSDILSGFYDPGERLLNKKVSDRLGVSITPVKNALLKLEQDGLVSSIPRRGTFVAQLTNRDVIDYSYIRMALECLAIDLACTQNLITDVCLSELKAINEQIHKAVTEENAKQIIALDIQFHQRIIGLSHNQRLVEMMTQFPLSNFLLLMGKGSKAVENGELIFNDHRKIIDALEARDAEAIKEILKVNIFLPYYQIFEEQSMG